MSNVRLSWVTPTPTARQRPIAGVRVDARVAEDLPWTTIDVVSANTILIQDVAPGTWFYRVTVIDEVGAESAPAFVSVEVGFDPPSAVTELTATIE